MILLLRMPLSLSFKLFPTMVNLKMASGVALGSKQTLFALSLPMFHQSMLRTSTRVPFSRLSTNSTQLGSQNISSQDESLLYGKSA